MIRHGLSILRLQVPSSELYSSMRRGQTPSPPVRSRVAHAQNLIDQLDQLDPKLSERQAAALPGAEGALISAIGPHMGDSALAAQLRVKDHVEVVSADADRAVIRVRSDLDTLRHKISTYATQNTSTGKPRFANLVARLDRIELTSLSDLSLGEFDDEVEDADLFWVEIWTVGGRDLPPSIRESQDAAVRQFASLSFEGNMAIPAYRGRERDVYLVRSTGEALKLLPDLLPIAVEIHRSAVVLPIELAEAADEAGVSVDVGRPERDDVAIVLHDSGIDRDHPYLTPILLGSESVVPAELSGDDAADGHGTLMAGAAAYSNLAEGVSSGSLRPDAWLVSVRLLDSADEAGGDPERGALWAERTMEAVDVGERLVGGRRSIHNFSIGADNPREGMTPNRTLWSVAMDSLAWNSGVGRLMVVAAGNAEPIKDRENYPYINLGPPHHVQPGQAWNVLTVGGFTNLAQLTQGDVQEGYKEPLAPAGGLSPFSRTAIGGKLPIKPEIVMEAGNSAPDGWGLDGRGAQGLSVLSLSRNWRIGGSPLTRAWATSPAAAAASNALAQLTSAHPELRPATCRGLLVHSARWPQAAKSQLADKRDLLRSFGYGVPHLGRSLYSSSNRPLMTYEGSIVTSPRVQGGTRKRRADFIEIPLPHADLDALGDRDVELRVTLSYFVEPTETLVRRDYAGGRLRWDLQGPSEEAEGFRARINRLVRDSGVIPGGGSYQWLIGPDARSRGTVQHDRAIVPASALAGSRLLAVCPVLGWWEDGAAYADRPLPYSLVVSVDLGSIDVDLHALVELGLAQISSQVSVEV